MRKKEELKQKQKTKQNKTKMNMEKGHVFISMIMNAVNLLSII